MFEQTIQEYPLPFLADKQAKDFLNPF